MKQTDCMQDNIDVRSPISHDRARTTKRKQELHDDVKFMLEYNGYPSTWETDGETIRLAKATRQPVSYTHLTLPTKA